MRCRAAAVLAALALALARAAAAAALANRTLRCCTLPEPPFVFPDPARKPIGFGGIAIEYLRLLQDELGFDCSSFDQFTAPDGSGVSFTAFIDRLEKCAAGNGAVPPSPDNRECQCDIGVGGWSINEERIHRVDFVQPFAFDHYRALTHVDNTDTSTGDAFFLTTFSVSVWGSIAALIVIFTFLKLLDRRFAPADETFHPLPRSRSRFDRLKHYLLKSRVLYRLRRAVQSTLSKMIGQSTAEVEGDYSSTRQWVLNFIVVLCGLFLVLAYEATMTASLVQEDAASQFRTINDLKNCHIHPEEVCLAKGGAAETYWNTAVAPNSERPHVRFLFMAFTGLVILSQDKRIQYLLARIAKQSKWRRRSGASAPFFGGSLSFVLPLGSELTKDFDSATLRLRNQDMIPTVESYLDRDGRCSTQKSALLTFRKLKLFFIFAFGACLVILAEMIIDPQQALKAKPRAEEEEDDDDDSGDSTTNKAFAAKDDVSTSDIV